MRTLMTLATLATAVAGYFYLQQPLVSDQSQSEQPTLKKLFDWGKNSTNSPADRIPVAELTTRIRERTRSVLDEFVRQNGAPAEGLADNPFQRLQEASSATTSLSLQDKTSAAVKSWHDTRSQSSDLDELQRIAFDPTRTVRSRKSDDYLKTETSPPPQGVHELTDRLDHRIATGNVNGSAPVQSANSDHWQADVSRGIVPAGETQAPAVPAPATIIFAQTKESSSSTYSVPRMSQIRQREETAGQSPTDRVATGTTKPQREVAGTSSEWNVIGKTTEGRPMHSMHLGNQGIRTLVIAGLDGEDRIAVRWLEQLAEELAKHPELLKTNEVVLFRAGNPDGLIHKTRENSRHVPLNRNFPSRRYRPTSDMPSFATPASEVETRVMLDTLYSFRPRRVIHLMATTARSQVLYNRAAREIATDLERSARINPMVLDAEQFPGSLEDFADGTLEAAVLSMRLSIGNDWQQAWTTLQPQLLSAVVGREIASSGGEVVQQPDPNRSPIPHAAIEPISRLPGRRGYEELPRPPK